MISERILRITQPLVSIPVLFLFRRYSGITVLGIENLRRAEELHQEAKKHGASLIVAANHLGDSDPILLSGLLREFSPKTGPLRAVSLEHKYYDRFRGVQKLFYRPSVFTLLGAIPAEVGHHDYAIALRQHMEALHNGSPLLIFPEGERSRSGEIGDGRGGVGFLASESRSCVLPVTIAGTWRATWPGIFSGKHHFVVSFGEPFSPEDILQIAKEDATGDANPYRHIAGAIMARIKTSFVALRSGSGSLDLVPQEEWPADSFEGEHTVRPFLNLCVMHVVAWWCTFSNFLGAMLRKGLTPRRSFPEVVWTMGRDPRHTSAVLFDGLSPWNHDVKVHAAGWRSLEPFYDYATVTVPEHERALADARTRGAFAVLRTKIAIGLSRYWMGHAHNRQALRNRLLITERLLDETISAYPEDHEVRILSVASGSGRAVLDVLERYPKRKFVATLLDNDAEAIAHSRERAEQAGLAGRYRFIHNGTSHLRKLLAEGERFDVIEMVGFLDYRPQDKAIRLSALLRDLLAENGTYIMANIQPNVERRLLDWALLWPMIYRTDEDFIRMLLLAGFPPSSLRIVHEPFHVHVIGVAKRSETYDNDATETR